MEKSIENVWKAGFLKKDALIAPKINNLYHQKSIHIIDKFKRMMKVNMYLILIFAFLQLGVYAALGTPIAGAFIFFLLIRVCWISMKRANTLKKIDANVSSYDYLKLFNSWLKMAISNNIKLMRFFYPLIFLAALMPIVHALKAEEMTNEAILNSGFHLIYGIPTFMWIIALVIAVLMYVFGGRIYQWDLNWVYGRVFKKLDELIADIEELNK
ncbi:hypothetical protein SAMN05421636_109145 [Pricia antarctica]|uniref:Uncharacterized protein n=1 Tax=Pricia antarctica TaxID=641691 RepID=A0A1G7HFC7_9FLAO|nr:hypothetical protein [Pricia antarctica]SDE99036.1 hypothetical protein SAMN05421636_109145 [Pricia antarctica]